MRKTPIAHRLSLSSILFVSIALFVGAYTLPGVAQADTVSCNTPVIGDFTPHVYNGHLDSFDYYVSDPTGTAYLPLATTIDGKSVDLNYVSVWHNVGSNRAMVHVDVPDELYLPADISISIGTLQVTQGPPPLCLSQATFHVNQGSASAPQTGGYGSSSTPISSNPAPVTVVPTPAISHPVPVNPKPVSNSTTPTPVATNSPLIPVGSQCQTIGTWWLLLLAALDVIISIALLLLMSFIAHSNGRLIAAVLIPPAVFIALWYFINTCRGDIWFPILSVILAIIVLTSSGTPDYFETHRVRIMHFFGKRTKNTQLKLAEASSIMEVR